jgi:predicted  nucleic acid-binding Zn-ribbon protein
MKTARALVCLLFLLCSLSFPLAAQEREAAPPAKDDAVLRALLDEVRQLRIALQRSQLGLYRAQLVIERLRVQQQRVDRLTEELEGVKEELSNLKLSLPGMEEMLKDLEGQLAREPDPQRRSQLAEQVRGFKLSMEQRAPHEQRLSERQNDLNMKLQVEQAKLAELNNKLEEWEKELELPDAGEKRQPAKKP